MAEVSCALLCSLPRVAAVQQQDSELSGDEDLPPSSHPLHHHLSTASQQASKARENPHQQKVSFHFMYSRTLLSGTLDRERHTPLHAALCVCVCVKIYTPRKEWRPVLIHAHR